MGHLMRAHAVRNTLAELGVPSILFLDADAEAKERAKSMGLIPLTSLPLDAAGALIIDAVSIPQDTAISLAHMCPRILISPVFEQAGLATHVLVRDCPVKLHTALQRHVLLEVDPAFAFVTASGLTPRSLDYSKLRIGVCLSGGFDPHFLEELLRVIAIEPGVSEIQVIARRAPELDQNLSVNVSYLQQTDKPWRLFERINVFIGGDGIMLAEAIAQGIPAISFSTQSGAAKNAALEISGALRCICLPPKGSLSRRFGSICPKSFQTAPHWMQCTTQRWGSKEQHWRAAYPTRFTQS